MNLTDNSENRNSFKQEVAKKPIRLLHKIVVMLVSLTLTVFLLEIVVRIFLPTTAPVLFQPGLYDSTFPLVNGREQRLTRYIGNNLKLPKKKTKGEIRIFVFGESSVEGAPFGHKGSPPTMLYDQLKQKYPNKNYTVINMGLASAFLMDSYYYLLGIRQFEPDVIIFYQGSNDYFGGIGQEMCLPLKHPFLHKSWRFIVEHFRLFWAARVYGPQMYLSHISRNSHTGINDLGRKQNSSTSCAEIPAFAAWTDIVVHTAAKTGARVIVTTPVQNTLKDLEYQHFRKTRQLSLEESLLKMDAEHQLLLSCLLHKECDFSEAVGKYMQLRQNLYWHSIQSIEAKGEQWKLTAKKHNAELIDFNTFIKSKSRTAISTIPLVLDEVHLSLKGYWLLASQWVAFLSNSNTEKELEDNGWNTDKYKRGTAGAPGILSELLMHGKDYIEKRMFLFGTASLQVAAREGSNKAKRVLNCLQKKSGIINQQTSSNSNNGFDRGQLTCQPSLSVLLSDISTSQESSLAEIQTPYIINLRHALEECASQSSKGYYIKKLSTHNNRITVEYAKETTKVKLFIGNSTEFQGFYLKNDSYGISYSNSTPLDTRDKKEVVNEIFQCLQKKQQR